MLQFLAIIIDNFSGIISANRKTEIKISTQSRVFSQIVLAKFEMHNFQNSNKFGFLKR